MLWFLGAIGFPLFVEYTIPIPPAIAKPVRICVPVMVMVAVPATPIARALPVVVRPNVGIPKEKDVPAKEAKPKPKD